jgi:hypothetical protein
MRVSLRYRLASVLLLLFAIGHTLGFLRPIQMGSRCACCRARFSAKDFGTMMSGYVQGPLGNSEHSENRRNESHTRDAEGRVE